jgi:serine/threonine-protein kinase
MKPTSPRKQPPAPADPGRTSEQRSATSGGSASTPGGSASASGGSASASGRSASASGRSGSTTGRAAPGEPAARTPGAIGSIGRYRLLGRIGEGGMAEVYRAVMIGPEGFERELVLKRILPRLSESGDFKTMFVREAKICAQMTHPNIIQIYEFGQADGGYFIAMESVQGVTLREALTTLRKEERALPHYIAAEVARQICVGLDYAHTLRGPDGMPLEIVHQDISPTNIMLAFTGTVKILDFGIARAAEFAEEEAKKGLIKGKVSYLSPEQIYVRPFDARADVFALGVVFHEMLTGRRLFQSKNDITRMRELLAAPILPPSAIDAMIPRELDRLVMKALEIDPKDRYQNATDMAQDLERTLIAARYSSRELSKLLHDMYMADDVPLVVVDAADDKESLDRTIAITSTTTLPPTEQTGPVRDRARAKEETQSRMGGVVRAERSRLERMRWVARIKVMMVALVIAVGIGAIAFAAKKFWPDMKKFVHPSGPPSTPIMKNQETPVPTPKPPPPPPKTVKKKPAPHGKTKGHEKSSSGAHEESATPPASGDAPLPPSDE